MSFSCLLWGFGFFFKIFLQDETDRKQTDPKGFQLCVFLLWRPIKQMQGHSSTSQSVCFKSFLLCFVMCSCRGWQKHGRETMCCLEEGIHPYYCRAAIVEWHHAALPRATFFYSNQKGLSWRFPTWGLGSPRRAHYESERSHDHRRHREIFVLHSHLFRPLTKVAQDITFTEGSPVNTASCWRVVSFPCSPFSPHQVGTIPLSVLL